jgi:hypothetical protein
MGSSTRSRSWLHNNNKLKNLLACPWPPFPLLSGALVEKNFSRLSFRTVIVNATDVGSASNVAITARAEDWVKSQ